MRYVATIGERQITVDVADNGHLREIVVDGIAGQADWRPVGDVARQPGGAAHYTLLLGTQSFDVYVTRNAPMALGAAPTFAVTLAGQTYDVRLEDERLHALAGMAGTTHEHGEAAITAPMPGLVSQVVAAVGQPVERGQTVIVLEAMKMENDLGAPRAGVVRQLSVAKGDTVTQGQVLAIIGDADGAGATEDEDEQA
jgi:biotin carboxyl carrier protein